MWAADCEAKANMKYPVYSLFVSARLENSDSNNIVFHEPCPFGTWAFIVLQNILSFVAVIYSHLQTLVPSLSYTSEIYAISSRMLLVASLFLSICPVSIKISKHPFLLMCCPTFFWLFLILILSDSFYLHFLYNIFVAYMLPITLA